MEKGFRRAAFGGLFVVAAVLGGLLITSLGPAGAQVPPCRPLMLDFAGLLAGTLLNEQYASDGIHISAIANEGRPNQLIVFNSNASGTRDPDLEVDIGNLAIIPEHLIDNNGDGLVDDPNDSIRGGKQIYSFDHDRTFNSFVIVDIDHGNPRSHFATAFDAAGAVIKRVPIPIGTDANVQTIQVNADGVRRLEITYRDSAGVTDIDLDCPPDEEPGALFIVIDEDSIDNGNPPNFFSDIDVNDQIATLAQRRELAFFNANEGATIKLQTGQVGDEGWFAVKTIPASWGAAGPTSDGLRNYLGNPSQAYPHNVGPGLGTGNDPESRLDKIPDVMPLRATGLRMLIGKTLCAVVYDSDISINYGPLNGSLKGANLGTIAFTVDSVTPLTGFSSGTLPEVTITIRDAERVCEGRQRLFTDAPAPHSSSEPYDTGR